LAINVGHIANHGCARATDRGLQIFVADIHSRGNMHRNARSDQVSRFLKRSPGMRLGPIGTVIAFGRNIAVNTPTGSVLLPGLTNGNGFWRINVFGRPSGSSEYDHRGYAED